MVSKAALAIPGGVVHIGNALGALFKGDFNLFFSEILHPHLLQVIGVFLFVYLLFHYIIRKTLIRDDEHKKTANGIAIGFALLGIVQARVFDIIAGFFVNSFVIMIIILVVFMVINVFNFGRGSMFQGMTFASKKSGEFSNAATATLKADHEFDKAWRDSNREDRLLRREKKNINKAQKTISGGFLTSGAFSDAETVEEKLMVLADLVAKISSLGTTLPSTDKRQQQLAKEATQLSSQIVLMSEHSSEIKSLLEQNDLIERNEFSLENEEENYEKKIHDLLISELSKVKDDSLVKADIQKTVHEDVEITTFAANAKRDLLHRNQIVKKLEALDKNALDSIDSLQTHLKSFEESLSNGRYQEARDAISSALSLVRKLKEDDKYILNALATWRNLRNHEDHLRVQLKNHRVRLQKDLTKDETDFEKKTSKK